MRFPESMLPDDGRRAFYGVIPTEVNEISGVRQFRPSLSQFKV